MKIIVSDKMIISNIDTSMNVVFVNCDFYGGIEFRGGTFNGISFHGGRITKPVMIYDGHFLKQFEIDQVNAIEMDAEIYYSFAFNGGTFESTISIYRGAFQDIYFGAVNAQHVVVRSGAVSSYNHDLSPTIKRLVVGAGNISVMEVYDFDIQELRLSELVDKGVFVFDKLQLTKIELKNLINHGQINFAELSVNSTYNRFDGERIEPALFISNSILGVFILSEIDLRNFHSVHIKHSNLTTVQAVNVSWFGPSHLTSLSASECRDIYRQLKHAMNTQGNKIDAMMFHELEMNFYIKVLCFRKHFWDLIVLKIEKYTNCFGTDYVRPALWLLCVSLVFFLGSLWIEDIQLCDRWGSIFVMINPAHATDYLVPKEQLSNAYLAWDFLGRILTSVLIFQFLSGFRKFLTR